VALFKHNIGAYALVGSVVFLIFENLGNARQTSAMSDKLKFVGHLEYRGPLVLLIGSATAIAPALGYMQLKDALAPMTRTLLFGPGEFLLNRLAIPLSPVAPLLFVAALAVTTYTTYKLRGHPPIAVPPWLILIA